MHSIAPLLIAVLVQALGEAGTALDSDAPWAVPILVLLPYLAVHLARRAGSRGRTRRAARWASVVRWSGALGFGIAVVACGWTAAVERWTGVSFGDLVWPEPVVLLSIAPFLVLQVLALHAESLLYSSVPLVRRRTFQLHLRGFAFVLLPVLVYLALTWLVGLQPIARAWLQWVGLAQGVYIAVVVALVASLSPYFMRYVFDTHPVPEGPARRLLELVAARAGLRPAEWLVWRTGGTMANAAVVGFTPIGRLVLFTDELLATLGPRELVAVVGHEIGHVRRGHVWIQFSYAVAFFLGIDLAANAALARIGDSPSDFALYSVMGCSLIGLVLGGLWFTWLSRRFELDADLYCAKLTGDGAALGNALRQVDTNWERGGWLHFSSQRRVAFLAEVGALPERGRALERLVARARAVGFTCAAAVVVAQLMSLVANLPRERIEAELALGSYAAATRAAAKLSPPEPDAKARDELELLVSVASEMPDGAEPASLREACELELERLSAILEAAEPTGSEAPIDVGSARSASLDSVAETLARAYAWSALAARRGDARSVQIERALGAVRRGDRAQLARHLAAVDDAFRVGHGATLAQAAALVAQ